MKIPQPCEFLPVTLAKIEVQPLLFIESRLRENARDKDLYAKYIRSRSFFPLRLSLAASKYSQITISNIIRKTDFNTPF